jgi:ankyrin repeat protein
MKLLLDVKTDVNAKDKEGKTALMREEEQKGSEAVVELLKAVGVE